MATAENTPQEDKNLIDCLKTIEVLTRVNNLLLSKLILSYSNLTKELNIPKRKSFFRFEILEDEYNSLVEEFGKSQTDKALYRLDRMLVSNKQNCPNNIGKYVKSKLNKNRLNRSYKNNG